jgi:hypothetical protein
MLTKFRDLAGGHIAEGVEVALVDGLNESVDQALVVLDARHLVWSGSD